MKKNYISRIAIAAAVICLLAVPASAGGLADSTLGVGLKRLFSDVSSYLMILCPIAGGAAAVYFAIRRAMSDEQDGKLWEKRIKTAIGCGVGGCLASMLISSLSSYF